MIQTNTVGNNYSENLLDPYLGFPAAQTWSVSSGTGTGATASDFVYVGDRALKIQNTAPTTNLVITNSTQNTVISLKSAKCQLSFYMRKNNVAEAYSGNVKIFKNAVLLDTQTWELEAEKDNVWYRFVSTQTYDLVTTDVITFTFQFDGDAGFVGAKTVYLDGLMLADTERLDYAPAFYTKPTTVYNDFTGWGSYADTTYTTGSPFTASDGVQIALPNNAGNTFQPQKPLDITTFYDGTAITGRTGDGINIVLEFKCRPTTAASNVRLQVVIDIGGSVGELYPRDFSLSKGSGVEHYYLSSFDAYTYDTWQTNGGIVKVTAVNDDIEIYDIRYVITRTHKAR